MAADTDSFGGRDEPATVSFTPSRDGTAEPTTAHAPEPGSVVAGKYRVERVLGSGGMGVVVSAEHLELGERVAIKFLVTTAAGASVARFRREAQVSVRMKNEHVVRVMDVGTTPTGGPFLVMEYLEGESLARRLKDRGPMSVGEAVDFVLQVMEAVAEAHRLGVVHRDLKPSNLFLTTGADGAPLLKVLDFGIAKLLEGNERNVLSSGDGARATSDLTAAAVVLGSPSYMSPEQVRSARSVDARSDVWSLGVVLYELVTGRLPFEAESPSGVMAAIVADDPVPLRRRRPAVPADFEELVLLCLDKDRSRRWPDVATLAKALAPFAGTERHPSVDRIARLAEPGRPAHPSHSREADRVPSADAGANATGATWTVPGRPRAAARWFFVGALAVAAVATVWIGAKTQRDDRPIALPEAATSAQGRVAGAQSARAETETIPAAAVASVLPSASASTPRSAEPASSARAMPPSASSNRPTAQPRKGVAVVATHAPAAAPAPKPDVEAATATRH